MLILVMDLLKTGYLLNPSSFKMELELLHMYINNIHNKRAPQISERYTFPYLFMIKIL